MLFSAIEKLLPKKSIPSKTEATIAESEPTETIPLPQSDNIICVLQSDGSFCKTELEQYLIGVLLGEMPMDFDIEALKAQAVVARTYTLRRSTVAPKHDNNAVCVDASCCQAYCPSELYLSSGGSAAGVEKATLAVSMTDGQVLVYNGALIEATYFSCSGGRTEDAVAVWGTDIPYLQAVESPGEENATHYTDTVSFSGAEFASLLGISLSGNPEGWFGRVTYTDGGGVDTMVIGGVSYKGTILRQKLGIKSTAFTITPIGNTLHVTTKGFGHRVGMSQYGAEAMAVNGSIYQEILFHYYPGTTLTVDNRN